MKKTEPEYYPPVENLLDLIYEHYTENNPVEKNTVAGKVAKAKEKELEEWKAKDPIPRFAKKLVETGTATQAELDAITASVAAEIEAAVKFAEDSPFPKPEDLLEDVYA